MKKIFLLILLSSSIVFAGNIERITISSTGTQSKMGGNQPSVSCDGKFVAFASYSNDLVEQDNNIQKDIFIRNLNDNTTERIFIANGAYSKPEISCNGKKVYFNYITDNQGSFYEYDVSTKNIKKILPYPITEYQVSTDNNHIVFTTLAQLSEQDNNLFQDVYLLTLSTNELTLISIGNNGQSANGKSSNPSVSSDGNYISFNSIATNLTEDDTNKLQDVFVKNLTTNNLKRIDIPNNNPNVKKYCKYNLISNSGKYVACLIFSYNYYKSSNNNLEILLYDNFNNKIINVNYDDHLINDYIGSQFGKFTLTDTFFTYANYIYDLRTYTKVKLIDRNISSKINLSGNGRYAVFESNKFDLIDDDTNSYVDVFIKDLYPEFKMPYKNKVYEYNKTEQPFISDIAENLKPIGLDDSDNNNLNIRVALPNFKSGVDVYFKIYVPDFSDKLFFLNTENKLVSSDSVYIPWKQNIKNGIDKQSLFGGINIQDLPKGIYYFTLIAADPADFNKKYSWTTSFTK